MDGWAILLARKQKSVSQPPLGGWDRLGHKSLLTVLREARRADQAGERDRRDALDGVGVAYRR